MPGSGPSPGMRGIAPIRLLAGTAVAIPCMRSLHLLRKPKTFPGMTFKIVGKIVAEVAEKTIWVRHQALNSVTLHHL